MASLRSCIAVMVIAQITIQLAGLIRDLGVKTGRGGAAERFWWSCRDRNGGGAASPPGGEMGSGRGGAAERVKRSGAEGSLFEPNQPAEKPCVARSPAMRRTKGPAVYGQPRLLGPIVMPRPRQ